ncbi:MAG: hypothetical protein K0S44_1295 [Bacteroidetes bacterium]|jgi:hypothetical protein|nr:hypothetical protein [Bacteroidota bacterium]
MKSTSKFLVSIFAVTAGLILTNALSSEAESNTSAAPASRTGSPADGASCTACHAGTATTVAGLITSTIPATGYIPGQTYTVTASITQVGKTKFGFEISPQTIAGIKKGTLVVTNSTATQLVGTGKYITHKTAGTSFPSGTATWTFNWTAPVAGSGDFTFYGAFNITNSSNTSSGDIVKLSTLAVSEDLSLGIEDMITLNDEINVFPNPVENNLHIVNSAHPTDEFDVTLVDIQGREIRRINQAGFGSFINVEDLSAGYYVLRIETEKGTAIKKIVKK